MYDLTVTLTAKTISSTSSESVNVGFIFYLISYDNLIIAKENSSVAEVKQGDNFTVTCTFTNVSMERYELFVDAFNLH